MVGRLSIAALLFGCVSAPLALAESAACPPEPRGPLEVVPLSGSTEVARNAFVRARYPRGHLATYDETLELFLDEEPEVPVPGTLEVVDDALFFIPAEELEPRTAYVARASGIDRSITARFRTGLVFDEEPPSAPVFEHAEAGVAAATCANPEGGVRLSFVFSTSVDDGGAASLQYSLYRTRGPELAAPQVLTRVAQEVAPGESQSVGAVLSEREAAGVSCFVLVAEDGLARAAESEEFCFEPGVGVIFDSLCSASDPRAASRSLAPTALALALMFVLRRRRVTSRGGSEESAARGRALARWRR